MDRGAKARDSSHLNWVAERVGSRRLLGELGHQDSDALPHAAQHLYFCMSSLTTYSAQLVLEIELVAS